MIWKTTLRLCHQGKIAQKTGLEVKTDMVLQLHGLNTRFYGIKGESDQLESTLFSCIYMHLEGIQ